jgi:hypothetical protein
MPAVEIQNTQTFFDVAFGLFCHHNDQIELTADNRILFSFGFSEGQRVSLTMIGPHQMNSLLHADTNVGRHVQGKLAKHFCP